MRDRTHITHTTHTPACMHAAYQTPRPSGVGGASPIFSCRAVATSTASLKSGHLAGPSCQHLIMRLLQGHPFGWTKTKIKTKKIKRCQKGIERDGSQRSGGRRERQRGTCSSRDLRNMAVRQEMRGGGGGAGSRCTTKQRQFPLRHGIFTLYAGSQARKRVLERMMDREGKEGIGSDAVEIVSLSFRATGFPRLPDW